ncbi:hypothetical protein [Pseudomonas sp. PB3P13]
MSTSVENYLGVFGPPTDMKGLCIWTGEKLGNAVGQLIWKPVWQAFTTNQIMNNPPTVAVCGDTMYAFYPSTSNQTNYLFYNTCNTGTLEWSDQEILKFSDPDVPGGLASIPTATGVGAAAFNGQVYVFWQGVNNVGSGSANGTLFYRTMNDATYHQINSGQSVEGNNPGVVMSNCPSAVVFNNLLYVFYRGPSGDSDCSPWYSFSSDGNTWSASTKVPNVGMVSSPSTVVFTNPSSGADQLYIFHQGEGGGSGDHDLFYVVMDTTGICSGDTQVPNVSMSATPSAGIYNGQLYVFYQGSNTSTFWYVYSSDGSTWSEPCQVADLKVSYAPSIVEFNSVLYCMMQGPGDDKSLWLSTFTPGSSNTSVIPMTSLPSNANSTAGCPSLVVSGGNLCCFSESSTSSGALLSTILTESGWSAQSQVLGAGTMTSSPSAVVFGPYTYFFFRGNNNTLQSFIWGEWDSPIQVPYATTAATPSAVVFNEQLYVFYETPAGQMPCNLAYSISNAPGGQTSSWSSSYLVPLNTVWDCQYNGVGPAAIVFNGDLYVFYLGTYENDPDDKDYYLCYYRLTTSGAWSSPYNVPTVSWSSANAGNFKPCPPVSPFAYNNELGVVYQDGSGNLYFISTANGTSWSEPVELSSPVPQATPPAAGTIIDWAINLGFTIAS